MKFSCNKESLAQACVNVSRAVISKSTLGALEGILIQAHDGKLSLSGYDLEFSITTCIDAQIEVPGEIVLNSRLFTDMVKKIPTETVTVSIDDKHLANVTGGSVSYTILGTPSEEFPEIPTVESDDIIRLPNAVFKDMVDHTIFAVSLNDVRPTHMGSLFEFKNGLLTVVSVDGYRLAIRREPLNIPFETSFIIPAKTLKEVTALFGEEGTCEIHAVKRRITFDNGTYTVYSRLIDGDFLEYEDTLPKNEKTLLKIEKRELLSGLDRVSLMISDRMKYPIHFTLNEMTMEIRCDTPLGKASDVNYCPFEGESIRLGFNSGYMIDALRACDCDKIKVRFNGPLSPIVIEPEEGKKFLYLVLPVRIK